MFLLYIFIGHPDKFLQVKGNLIALPFLLCYSVCYCVGRFPLITFRSRVRNQGERWLRPLLSGAFSVESSRTNDGRTLTTKRKEMEEIPEGNHNSKEMEEVLKNGDNHGEDLYMETYSPHGQSHLELDPNMEGIVIADIKRRLIEEGFLEGVSLNINP